MNVLFPFEKQTASYFQRFEHMNMFAINSSMGQIVFVDFFYLSTYTHILLICHWILFLSDENRFYPINWFYVLSPERSILGREQMQ